MHVATVAAGVCAAAMCLVAACSNPDPLGAETRSVKSIVVGSGDFPESEIIAEIYAQALQANGFDVGLRPGIGSRETYVERVREAAAALVADRLLLQDDADRLVAAAEACEPF